MPSTLFGYSRRLHLCQTLPRSTVAPNERRQGIDTVDAGEELLALVAAGVVDVVQPTRHAVTSVAVRPVLTSATGA